MKLKKWIPILKSVMSRSKRTGDKSPHLIVKADGQNMTLSAWSSHCECYVEAQFPCPVVVPPCVVPKQFLESLASGGNVTVEPGALRIGNSRFVSKEPDVSVPGREYIETESIDAAELKRLLSGANKLNGHDCYLSVGSGVELFAMPNFGQAVHKTSGQAKDPKVVCDVCPKDLQILWRILEMVEDDTVHIGINRTDYYAELSFDGKDWRFVLFGDLVDRKELQEEQITAWAVLPALELKWLTKMAGIVCKEDNDRQWYKVPRVRLECNGRIILESSGPCGEAVVWADYEEASGDWSVQLPWQDWEELIRKSLSKKEDGEAILCQGKIGKKSILSLETNSGKSIICVATNEE